MSVPHALMRVHPIHRMRLVNIDFRRGFKCRNRFLQSREPNLPSAIDPAHDMISGKLIVSSTTVETPPMNSLFSGPLPISDLMQHKALEPLNAAAQGILIRTQSLDVTGYTEADVREEIISPLLQVLGYDKQSYFSIDREKEIQLLGRKNFLDYNLTLWSENFWLIEAKKPKGKGIKFGVADIRQAVGYAGHPKINAALTVLCDGRKIAVFDREQDQIVPILTVEIANLQRDIDKLRSILSPWQVWFFEKRRIVRHLDKVFDKEFNIARVEEFKTLITRRLDSKRGVVIDNMRTVLSPLSDAEQTVNMLRNSEPADLIEGAFFLPFNDECTKVIAETLVRHCEQSTFRVLYRVFPDHARDMNDQYCMHALNFLIHLQKEKPNVEWLPAWLGGGKNLENAIRTFTASCLSHFASDQVRRSILLCAAGIRRLFKAIIVVDESVWRIGQVMHVLERYVDPEDSWPQLLSSPERQNLLRLDGASDVAVARLVRECSDNQGRPRPGLIETRLREIWKVESGILEAIPSYRELLRERALGEIHPTEATGVVYDSLGHGILCIADHHPVWKSHILKHHRLDVETLAKIGSWQARKWLGYNPEGSYPRPTDEAMADRFFLGDLEMYRRLKSLYGYAYQ